MPYSGKTLQSSIYWSFVFLVHISWLDGWVCRVRKNIHIPVENGILKILIWFKFIYSVPNLKIRVIAEWTDSLQVETNRQNGTVLTSKITWTDDCPFELRRVKTSYGQFTQADSFFMHNPIKVKILGGNKDYYVYSSLVEAKGKPLFQLNDALRFYKE